MFIVYVVNHVASALITVTVFWKVPVERRSKTFCMLFLRPSNFAMS